MRVSAPSYCLILWFTILVAPAICDDVNILAEKLVDWNGLTENCEKPYQITKQSIRDAYDSAMDIAYQSSSVINWDYHPAQDFLGQESRIESYKNDIKSNVPIRNIFIAVPLL